MAGVERLLGEAAGEGACLRNRSDGQRALMPQLKAGKRNSSAEVAPAYCKLAKAGAALELLGAIERCGASSARNAFCTNILDLLRRASRQKQSLRQRRLHLSPRAAEENFQSMDSRSISSGWGGEDRVRRWCKWPGRSYLQCLWPLRWSLGYHRIGHGTRRVVGTSPQLTGGGRTRARGCSCHLRARCRCHRRCGHQGRGRGYPSD